MTPKRLKRHLFFSFYTLHIQFQYPPTLPHNAYLYPPPTTADSGDNGNSCHTMKIIIGINCETMSQYCYFTSWYSTPLNLTNGTLVSVILLAFALRVIHSHTLLSLLLFCDVKLYRMWPFVSQ